MKHQEIKLIYSKDEISSVDTLGGLEIYLSKPKSTAITTPLYDAHITVDEKVLALHIQARLEIDWRILFSALALLGLEFDQGEFILGGYTPIYQATNILELGLKDVTFPAKYLVQSMHYTEEQFMGERYRSERPRSTRGNRSERINHQNSTEFSVVIDEDPAPRLTPRALQANHTLSFGDDKNELQLGRDRDEKASVVPTTEDILEPRPEWTDSLNDAAVKLFAGFKRPHHIYIKQFTMAQVSPFKMTDKTFTISVGGIETDKQVVSGKFVLFAANSPICEITARRVSGKFNYALYVSTINPAHLKFITDFMMHIGMNNRSVEKVEEGFKYGKHAVTI